MRNSLGGALVLCVFAVAAQAQDELQNPRADYVDGTLLTNSARSVVHAMNAIFDPPPGVRIETKIVYQTKEDEDEGTTDDHDTTIGCYGIPEVCNHMETIIDIVMEDPDHWACTSVPEGVECTHRPH
ncbi:hypothetical protein SAMN05444415_10824 [Salipiger profundus]|nr:hypothetical protein SAMN05444415_10824 [Salipiger profundus]